MSLRTKCHGGEAAISQIVDMFHCYTHRAYISVSGKAGIGHFSEMYHAKRSEGVQVEQTVQPAHTLHCPTGSMTGFLLWPKGQFGTRHALSLLPTECHDRGL